jgi:hypothetical protein
MTIWYVAEVSIACLDSTIYYQGYINHEYLLKNFDCKLTGLRRDRRECTVEVRAAKVARVASNLLVI